MKNYKMIDGRLVVESDGVFFEIVEPSEDVLKLVLNSECTCSLIPIMEIQSIFIGGIEDCPIHGIKGEEDEIGSDV